MPLPAIVAASRITTVVPGICFSSAVRLGGAPSEGSAGWTRTQTRSVGGLPLAVVSFDDARVRAALSINISLRVTRRVMVGSEESKGVAHGNYIALSGVWESTGH